MLRLSVLLTALALAIVGLAAIALHLHSELSELKSSLQATSSLQPERSGVAKAASTPREEQRRLAKLGLVDWNHVTGTTGCVRVPVSDADISLALNTKACNGHACPPCFGLNATPGMTRGIVVFSGCSEMYVGKQRLGSGSFVDALQQLEFINLNTQTSVAISDGAREFLIPPGANVMGACLADGTHEIHLDASLRTFWRPGGMFEQISSAPPWSARYGHTAVVRADGVVLVMGGTDGTLRFNDVYSSADGGISWSLLVASAGWSARESHQAVVRADGAVLVLGGDTGPPENFVNDVWCSVDGGSSWTLLTSTPSWSARTFHVAVALLDGSVLVMGGLALTLLNDVHSSADGGTNWLELPSATWSKRWSPAAAVLSDGAVLIMGGLQFSSFDVVNDVYRSEDGGVSWTSLTAAAAWSPRQESAVVQRADGALLLVGGNDGGVGVLGDVYISTDGGANWELLTSTPGWAPRQKHTVVVRSDGALLVLGGVGCISGCNFADVFKSEL